MLSEPHHTPALETSTEEFQSGTGHHIQQDQGQITDNTRLGDRAITELGIPITHTDFPEMEQFTASMEDWDTEEDILDTTRLFQYKDSHPSRIGTAQALEVSRLTQVSSKLGLIVS